jgi:DNA repair protein RecN (Recombination protein N)
MLQALSIRDVVLIDALDIEADSGLSALTGETGAGKSILLDALGLALGARGDSTLVRKGANQASVTAAFTLKPKHPVFKILDEQGISHDNDGAIILRRVLGVDGRSKAFINDQMAGVNLLRQVGELLVDIHGQFETHGLMDPKTHRGTLDDYAGADTNAVHSAWSEMQRVTSERDDLLARLAEAKRDQEYWQAACDDLTALDPKEGEEESLHAHRTMLAAREQVASAFGEANDILEGENGAIPQLNRAWKVLDRVAVKAGENLTPAIEALDRAASDMRSALDILAGWFDKDSGPDTLEEVDDRLHALRAAARKHQCRVDDLPRMLADISERLSAIRGNDGRIAELDRAVKVARAAYESAAKKLSDTRHKAASSLDKKVMAELPPLKLDKARFETQVKDLPEEQWGPNGLDAVQFVVATNPGAAPGPIDKIASGGELSRFMLAIKVVLAATSPVPVLVFDEVDAGIGGATADAVGERLARLADSGRQVLVVTHSPQVAARAGNHWIVSKAANDGTTRTTLLRLRDQKHRTEEIARMISGAKITPEALAAAGKLLQQAS